MPHLQFDINKKLNKESKNHFISFVEESFSKIMETGKDHIAISIRELKKNNLSLLNKENIWEKNKSKLIELINEN